MAMLNETSREVFKEASKDSSHNTDRKTLPASPLFNRLLRFAHAVPQRICIRDDDAETEHTHLQLLTDVLSLRERVSASLEPETKQALETKHEVYIAILAPGSYEYAVAVLAVLALGAAVVPLSVAVPAGEAVYFVEKSMSVAVLCAEGLLSKGEEVSSLIATREPGRKLNALSIKPSCDASILRAEDIKVSSDGYLDENAPGVVIFTSGTTGPPKGACMRRAFVHDTALAVADHYALAPTDTFLHLLPVHHATGIGINFFPALIAGCLIEFRSGSFSAQWTWERWKRGDVAVFSGVPTIYMRMQRFFEQELAARPDVEEYVAGARRLKACMCGTSALPKPIADFWARVLGKKILLRYGATEFGAIFKVRTGDEAVPDGSVGNLFPGVDVRLRGENGLYHPAEGEVCVRSPAGEMFCKYLDDPDATAKAYTGDNFFRTGDIARRENGYYWILGRASIDILKSGGYKISALDIEREILGLPYVAEVMVVGVADLEFGERVGAVLVLKESSESRTSEGKVSIDKLRQDLRSRLAGYKMPTLLRVIEEELPKSGTGKVVKKVLGPQFFPSDYRTLSNVQVWSPPQAKAKL